jgi:hypothetical protein
MACLEDLYQETKSRIETAATKAGRKPEDIELIAVSKTWPIEIISNLVNCGHRKFGENKVQEIETKVPSMPSNLEWHFIGHLQKNKVRKVLPLVKKIHSVDSLQIAQRINHIANDLGLFPKVLLQVNDSNESSKHGFSPSSLVDSFDDLLKLDRIEIEGLMSIPPFDPDPENVRANFIFLRNLRDKIEKDSGVPLPQLSMGMSNDYEIAIEEGATAVRVGSSIFGKRKYIEKREP